MTTLKISILAISLLVSLNASAQTKQITKTCTIHVLTQGGSPTATTVKVCN